MPKRKKVILKIALSLTLMTICLGCGDDSSTVAREAANRQAQQNTAMAELNKEVASGTHQLVEADAQARKEMVAVHHDLQQERSRLDAGWTELHGERRSIAGEHKTESMLVSVTTIAGSVLLVVLLFGFCRHLLAATEHVDVSTAELQELLVQEVFTAVPPLLNSGATSPSLLSCADPSHSSATTDSC